MMKPGRLWALVAAVTLPCSSAAFSPEANGTDVFTHGESGYSCFRIPALVALPSGTLALFAEGRKLNCRDHGWIDIVYKMSSDGGVTWGPMQIAYSESNATFHMTIGNPSPVAVGGRVLLVEAERVPHDVIAGLEPGQRVRGDRRRPDQLRRDRLAPCLWSLALARSMGRVLVVRRR